MYAHAYAITEDENRISQAKKMRLLNKKGKNSSKSKVTSWKHLLHQRICFTKLGFILIDIHVYALLRLLNCSVKTKLILYVSENTAHKRLQVSFYNDETSNNFLISSSLKKNFFLLVCNLCFFNFFCIIFRILRKSRFCLLSSKSRLTALFLMFLNKNYSEICN